MAGGMSRRQFVAVGSGGLLALALPLGASAQATTVAGLSSAEQATATGLINALARQPALTIDGTEAQAFASDLAAFCDSNPSATGSVVSMLDRLQGGRLVTGNADADLKAMQTAMLAGTSTAGPQTQQASLATTEAVTLARAYFGYGREPLPELLVQGS